MLSCCCCWWGLQRTVVERAGSSTALLEAPAPWIDLQYLNMEKGQNLSPGPSPCSVSPSKSVSRKLRRFLQWLSQIQADKDFPQLPSGSGASSLCSPAPQRVSHPCLLGKEWSTTISRSWQVPLRGVGHIPDSLSPSPEVAPCLQQQVRRTMMLGDA